MVSKAAILLLFLTNTSALKEKFDETVQLGMIAFCFLVIIGDFALGN